MTVPDSLSENGHDALRADIRRLSTLLGQTIAHHSGPDLLELVERVRKESRAAAGDSCRDVQRGGGELERPALRGAERTLHAHVAKDASPRAARRSDLVRVGKSFLMRNERRHQSSPPTVR